MRASGILMPIFSLPSKYGIGTLGKEAYNFTDFLKKAGQTYWQILPVGVTGFGDSPYQCYSAFAGNPYFIDLELLCKDGLIEKSFVEDFKWEDSAKVDYDNLSKNRYTVLRQAYSVFKSNIPKDFEEFKAKNSFWLKDYALYFAIKDNQGGKAFDCWEEGYKLREPNIIKRAENELSEDIGFYEMLQYLFYKQWAELKEYANKNGVYIIGDMPIYVAFDSADVWSNPSLFQLDENLVPKAVAGCPPDAFSEDGQLWGNPLYDWKKMKADGYDWWVKRVEHSLSLYDTVRIDHFRAFSAYFSIPAKDDTAKNGKWIKGPRKELFNKLNEKIEKLNIIAEDLGTIDDDVRKLLKFTGFPGMKVLQFAFDPESESSYLPHNIDKNCVVYTGTHDNDTAIGYFKSLSEKERKFVCDYLRIAENESFNWEFIKSAMATSADTVILQMPDFLGLDNSARINTPATTEGNWQWRIDLGCTNDWLAGIIRDITALYYRLGSQK